MSEKRLGELTEQEFMGMMDFMFSEEFERMPASEFLRHQRCSRLAPPLLFPMLIRFHRHRQCSTSTGDYTPWPEFRRA